MDDYLADNPTRNRALDMLPLFRHLDEKRVMSAVPDDLIKARPTFHYRLPGCEIHRADWGLFSVWNDWAVIEQLAESEALLEDALSHYQRQRKRFLSWFGKKWQTYMAEDIIPALLEQRKKD